MYQIPKDELSYAREKYLADGMVDVASELRLVDVCDLITYIRSQNFGNVSDLVKSSAELYFKPGTLSFSWGADIRMNWKSQLSILFDLEFRHAGVTVFFCLELQDATAGVDIAYISFDDRTGDPAVNTMHLRQAIADARVVNAAPEHQRTH